MGIANKDGMLHSVRRVKEFLSGQREELKLKDFEGLITLISEEGYVAGDDTITLVDSFANFEETINVYCTLTPVREREHYVIKLTADSVEGGIVTPIECNTVLHFSFKDGRIHQTIDLSNGVMVKSSISYKNEARFVSMVRSRLAVTTHFNLGVNFRVDKSLFENDQLMRAAGYDKLGSFVSITGKGKVAVIEDHILTELGYLPLDKELSNVFTNHAN